MSDQESATATAAGTGPSMAPGPGITREPDAAAVHEAPGTRIGPYKLLQPLGEGGFGTAGNGHDAQAAEWKAKLEPQAPRD